MTTARIGRSSLIRILQELGCCTTCRLFGTATEANKRELLDVSCAFCGLCQKPGRLCSGPGSSLCQRHARKAHSEKYGSLGSSQPCLATTKCIRTAGLQMRKISATASDSFSASVGRETFFADLYARAACGTCRGTPCRSDGAVPTKLLDVS